MPTIRRPISSTGRRSCRHFDYAGDGWGYSYGAAAEWYTGRWTLRPGIFDLSTTPAGDVSPLGYALDANFSNFERVGEIEERHQSWGQTGKIKITRYLQRGSMGVYSDAIALAAATGLSADIKAVRSYTGPPGVGVNFEQGNHRHAGHVGARRDNATWQNCLEASRS